MDKKAKESKSAATIRRRTKRSALFGNFFSKQKSVAADPFESDGPDSVESESDPVNSIPAVYPTVLQGILSSEKKLFWSLVTLRLLNALVIQTSYVPDEYWQSTEVAHNMVFGYGYLTWEWKRGIRSYIYPLIFAILYKFLAIFHMDSRFLVVKGPRLIQGVFAALGDLYVYRLTVRLSGIQVARWTLFCQLTSWFTFYTSTRTLSNSMEQILTSMALYYYPWPCKPKKALWKYLILVSVAVIIRPTAAITWLPLLLFHLFTWNNGLWKVVRYSAERGLITLAISFFVDRICYGYWINVHYNFLQFNVLSGLSGFYGTHPWHWYLTQGLPVVLGTHLIILLVAVWKFRERIFIASAAWCIVVYSFLSHKEFRFLSGVLPLIMHVCGCTLHETFTTSASVQRDDHQKVKVNHGQTLKVITVATLLVINVPVALYFSLIHQRGTVDVMSFIHKEAQKIPHDDVSMSVLYLMPCHSTPYYSYVHRNITMHFLTCEPIIQPLVSNYTDEADQFYRDPMVWLDQKYSLEKDVDHNPLPTHVVLFDELYIRIHPWLRQHNFHLCDRFFHTHFPEGRVSSYTMVACRSFLPHVQPPTFSGSSPQNISKSTNPNT